MPWKVKYRSHSEEQAHARSFFRRLSFKKELRSPQMLRLDAASVKLIIYAEQASMPISGRIVMAMARKLARELKIPHQSCPPFTRNSWLRHFLARYNLHPKRSHGEIGSVDVEAAMQQLETLRDRIRQFHPFNVYNMDETALYYKATPRTPVVLKKAPASKQDKLCVTMVVGANVNGTDKLPLVFLGKAVNPRWLAEKPADVQYIGTTKGWMTVGVYQAWLTDLDERMAKEDRNILLHVDNAPVRIHRDMNLRNVSILVTGYTRWFTPLGKPP